MGDAHVCGGLRRCAWSARFARPRGGMLARALPLARPRPPPSPRSSVLVLRCVAAWFTLTICVAVRKARLGERTVHRAFMLRHVAAGLWVAGQRLYIIGFAAKTPEAQKANFGDAGIVAFVAAAAIAEGAIALLGNARVDIAAQERKKAA